MADNPLTGDIVRLHGQHPTAWRRRVGAYRIFYDLDPVNHFIFVRLIERRTTTTYRKR